MGICLLLRRIMLMAGHYNKCPKCLTILGWKTEVCPECHYDLKNKVEIQPQNDFMEHVFPWLLLGLSIAISLAVAMFRAGPAVGFTSVLLTYSIVLFVHIPISIVCLFGIGWFFSIDYGSIFTGVIKLAALFMFANSMAILARQADYSGTGMYISITLLIMPVLMYYLFAVLFNLSIWETILSLVSLYLLTIASRIALVLLMQYI
jgi:hypothetical protein